MIGTERTAGRPPTALLAREHDGELEHAGAAMVTLRDPERERFWRILEQLKTPGPSIPIKAQKAHWAQPRLRVRSRFLKGGGKLRHATLTSLVVS